MPAKFARYKDHKIPCFGLMMRTNPTNNNEQHTSMPGEPRESGDLEKKSGRRSDGGNMLIMIVLTVGGAGHNDHQTQAIISDIN